MDDLTVREIVRGMFLRALLYDRSRELADVALKATIRGAGYEFTIDQVRQEINYLEDKYLIEKTIKNSNLWMARLTAKGVDVLEGREQIKGIIVSE